VKKGFKLIKKINLATKNLTSNTDQFLARKRKDHWYFWTEWL